MEHVFESTKMEVKVQNKNNKCDFQVQLIIPNYKANTYLAYLSLNCVKQALTKRKKCTNLNLHCVGGLTVSIFG